MSAPAILDQIKEDLGITDNASDAWLQRRINGAWARIEKYTGRVLATPPASFVDDWGQISHTNPQRPVPPMWHDWSTRASVFLRYFPVTELVEVRLDGTPALLTALSFDPATGKLFGVDGSEPIDMSNRLRGSNARITYKAGWAELPPDLYEIVLGVVSTQWAAKGNSATGGIGGVVSSVSLGDVGSIEVSQGNAFVVNAGRSAAGSVDPLLGPYITMLDDYIDHRSKLGWEGQATTVQLPAPVPPP